MIAAAGSGSRLGAGGPKALVELAGRPLIAWSLAALAAAESVEAILVAAPPGHEAAVADVARALGAEAAVVAGGETRSESVANGLERVETELVAIHDAARPLVTPALVDELVAALAAQPDVAGVIAAAPMADTVKRAETREGALVIAATEDREQLWAAQTPQVFRAEALRNALGASPEQIAAATDEAMLVEQAGGTVLIHRSFATNLKVTTGEDLRLAALLLSG